MDDLTRFQNRLIVHGWSQDDVPLAFIRGSVNVQAMLRPGYRFGLQLLKEGVPSSEVPYFKVESKLCPLSLVGGSQTEAVAIAALGLLERLMPIQDFVSPGLVTTVGDDGKVCVTIYACVPAAAIPGYQALWAELVKNAIPDPKDVDFDIDVAVE